jgi:hypothetical protein
MCEIATTMFEKHCQDVGRMKAFSEARIEFSIVNDDLEQQSDDSCKDMLTSVKIKKVNGTIIPKRRDAFQPQGVLGKTKISNPKVVMGCVLQAEFPEQYGSDKEDEKQYASFQCEGADWKELKDLKGDFEKLFDSTEMLLLHTGDELKYECGIRSKKDLEEWVGDMLEIFDKHEIESIDSFLWKCLSLVHPIPIFILQGMIRKAVEMSIRSCEDDARKAAFIEAGIEFEIMKSSHLFHYPDVDKYKIYVKKSSIVMKKNVEGNEKDEKDTHDNMETEEEDDDDEKIFTF